MQQPNENWAGNTHNYLNTRMRMVLKWSKSFSTLGNYEHPDDVLLRFLRGLQNSRSNIVIAETRDYFPESQMRFIPPIHACFLKKHIQQMKIGSRQHPLPAEKKTLSGKPYLYNKEKKR